MDNLGYRLTDHAFARYVERVIGISRDELAAKIITPTLLVVMEKVKIGVFRSDGLCVAFKDGYVTTIYIEGED